MRKEIIMLTAAAFYGKKVQEFSSMQFDADFFETVRFLTSMSAKIKYTENGTVYVEPVTDLPKPGSEFTFVRFAKENALFFLGAAVNLGLTFKFTEIRNGCVTREEADALSEYVRGIMQISVAPNGFAASSANFCETNGCVAHAPFEFAAGLLLTLPLIAVNSYFGMGGQKGNELTEWVYDRLKRYDLVTNRFNDTVYIKSLRTEMLSPKQKKLGRPKKIPTETEKA